MKISAAAKITRLLPLSRMARHMLLELAVCLRAVLTTAWERHKREMDARAALMKHAAQDR